MPTRPRGEVEPHRHRQIAESFGTDAARYDRARPRYPAAMVERIVAASPGLDVLNVGCGTGIEARQFQAAGCAVLGVEPDERMADFARHRGLVVDVATFEGWEPAGRTFDLVVAGTAWHWVDPVAGAAKAAQVLRPGGRLAPFWHVFQPSPDAAAAFVDAFHKHVPDSPFNFPQAGHAVGTYQPMFAKVVDSMREAGGFGDPEQWRYDWTRQYTRDEWLDQLPTQGALAYLPPDTVAAVLADVGDALGDTVTVSYTTVVVTASKE